MKAEIFSTPYYFGRTWQLKASTPKKEKVFFLGQDVKVCRRLLGMTPDEVVQTIGTNDIGNGSKGAKRLGRLIADCVGLNGRNMDKVEAWEIAVE